ncbi:hypothetical protein [Flavobacterium sp. 1355]|jgi:hypothetical protein|uniref:hypothetical protein n=1 Tax=Flavobacterium sp. 1355 TaxID=2806571 RepID=UPI001AE1231B|nr:hypothetical protein [Flavobacterium sp. 1355]MBP1223587.1 hypothetical protein [Flavobacterium sp. 1355]
MYRFLFVFILFFSCTNGKNNSQSTENLNAIKSKMMMEELEKYLKHADEVTNNEVKEFHINFYKDGNECLFEINYENNLYSLENVKSNDGHLNVNGKTIFFHGLNLFCTKDFINSKFLKKEKATIKRHGKKYKYGDDLFQLYLITENSKLRRLAKA